MKLAVLMAVAVAAGPSDLSETQARRAPVALAFSVDGARLVVANRGSGSLSVINPGQGKVVGEHRIGRGLADLVPLPDGRWLAVDQVGDALLLVEFKGDVPFVRQTLAVGHDPVAVGWNHESRTGAIASLGSRQLTLFDIQGSRIRVHRTVRLPFAPRKLATFPDGKQVVVTEAFGGKIAVVDADSGTVQSVRALPVQNVRGLGVTPDGRSFLIAHQVLNKSARADFEGVHWGRLLNNQLRTLRASSILSATTDMGLLDGQLVFDLDSFGNGAGDPGGLAIGPSGEVAVVLSGVDEVAFGPHATDIRRRIPVGRRPVSVAFAPDGLSLYTADGSDDTVTIVDFPAGVWRKTISLGPRPAPDGVERGERLFNSARLSHDGWMSCQSCHADGQSTGGLADTLGDGSYGAPKLVPSLLGVSETGPWAWNGSKNRLEDQVRQSVETTMQGSPPTDRQVDDLTAYLRSLAPIRRSEIDGAAVRGEAVFAARKCASCHAPPTYTSTTTYDVGLADENGRRSFNPPSLRGAAARTPLLHDGRADSLRDVFLKHRHPRGALWSDAEVNDLVAFLATL